METHNPHIHKIYYYDGHSRLYQLPERVTEAKEVMEWLEEALYYTCGAYVEEIKLEYGDLAVKCVYEGNEEKYPFKLMLEVMKRKDNRLYVSLRTEQYEHPLLDDILWMTFLPDFVTKGELKEVSIQRDEYRM